MLVSTDLPNDDERGAALAAVPWRESARLLTAEIYASYDNHALDLIDASIGPNNQCRAALVAILEGVGSLQQATVDLAESVLRQRVFARVPPVNPLTVGDELEPALQARVTSRYAAHSIEDAAVRAASAGDHLANAHVRLAWEANAATLNEVERCGFDPAKAEPERWITVAQLRTGIERAERDSLSVFPRFAPNRGFLAYADSEAVVVARGFRDHVVHRERPRYRELPGFGRTTLWTQGNFEIACPPTNDPDERLPTLDQRRREIGRAIVEALRYGEDLWAHTKRWLSTIGVLINLLPGAQQVEVTTTHRLGWQTQRFPRENRDPGPFLRPRET